MTALLVGLLLGTGVFCIYWSFWPRSPRSAGPTRPGWRARLADELVQAGFDSVTPGQLVTVCVILFVLVVLATWPMTRAFPVAVCFAVIAGYGPRAFVAGRARRRRAQLRDLWPDAVDNITSAVRAGMALPEALSQLASSRSRGAAAGVCRVRGGLPRVRTVPRVPRPAQGPAGRPGGRPAGRVAADRSRGGRLRPGPGAAHPVQLPARGRPHPRRAGDATGLDGERGPPGRRGALGGPGDDVHPAGVAARLQLGRGCGDPRASAAGYAWSPIGSWCGSAGCPRKNGCCGDRVVLAGCPTRAHAGDRHTPGRCEGCRRAVALVWRSGWPLTCATLRHRRGCSRRPRRVRCAA